MPAVRRAPLFLCLLGCLCLPAADVGAQALAPELRIDRRVLDGSVASNLLAPASMALDPWRGLLYVRSPRSPRVAVLDPLDGRRLPDLVLLGGLEDSAELVAFNPRSRLLVLRERRGAAWMLVAVDAYTGAVAARFEAGEAPLLEVERDPARDALFVSRGSRAVLHLDGATLAVMDSLPCTVATAGLAVDSLHGVLYAAAARADSGTTTLTLFSTKTLERLRSYTLPADTPMTRVAVDPALQYAALIGGGLIRLFDDTGLPLYTERVSPGMGPHAMSPTFHHLVYLQRDPAEGPGIFGTRRRLCRFRMDERDFDSTAAGPAPVALAVLERTFEAAVLCSDAATVEVYDIFTFAPRRTLRLGRSAESIAATRNGEALFVASATGPASVVTRVNLDLLGGSDFPAGGVPVRVAADPASGNVVALLNFENRFLLLDPETGATEQSFVIPGVGEHRSPAWPSFALDSSGLLLALFPGQNLQALVRPATQERLRIARVDGYAGAGNDDPGSGALQGVFLPGTPYYAVLRLAERKANLYAVNQPGLLREIDLATLDWSRIAPFERICLRAGFRPGEFFIGPYRFDSAGNTSGSAPGAAIPVAPDGPSGMLALRFSADSGAELLSLRADNLAELRGRRLLPRISAPDDVCWNAVTRRLFLSYSDSGLVLAYFIDEGSSIQEPERNYRLAIDAHPNPVSLAKHAFLAFRLEQGSSAVFADQLGRILWRAQARQTMQELQIPLWKLAISPGMYFLSIRDGVLIETVKIRTIP